MSQFWKQAIEQAALTALTNNDREVIHNNPPLNSTASHMYTTLLNVN